MSTFSLTPANNVKGVLDFSTKVLQVIYDKATCPLPIDPFDCVHTQLNDFMAALSKRAHDFGWVKRIMKIPLESPVQADTLHVNMLKEHATVGINVIQAYEQSYAASST